MGIEKNSKAIVTQGLVLYLDAANPRSYPGSGSTWKDLSGFNRHGTLQNAPVYSTENMGALGFNGTNQRVLISGDVLNYVSQPFSFCMWVYVRSYTTNIAGQSPILFYKGEWQKKGYYCGLSSSGPVSFQTNQSGANQVTSTNGVGVVPLNVWKQVAVVRNGSSVRIYIDGIDCTAGTGATHINPATSADTFRIANYQGDGNIHTNCKIGQFMNYNIALSATEVLHNYEAQKGRYI